MDCLKWDDGRMEVDARYAERLRAAGLDAYAKVMALEAGRELGNHRDRPVHRVAIGDGVFYLKRYLESHRKNSVASLIALQGPCSTARREWRALVDFHGRGLPVARAVAMGEEFVFGVEKGSFLITEELAGVVPLNDYLRDLSGRASAGEFRREKRAWLERAGALVGKMHDANCVHGDLYLKHLLVHPATGAMTLFDLARAEARARISKTDQACDLAALNASAPASWFGRTDRLRFFLRYKNRDRILPKDRRLIDKILRRSEKLLGRKKFLSFQNEKAVLQWSRAPR